MRVNTIKQFIRRFYASKFFAPVIIALFVIAANGLYVSGLFNANPINVRSGLVDTITLGPLNGQFTIDPSDGYYAQALGRGAALDVLRGNIPWWNYYEGVGAPLIGGLQSAALFPLQFLLVLPNGLLFFHICLEIIAGLGTYYFLKRLRLHDKAALVGGAAFAVNGTFAWLAHTIVNPVAFLPWLMLAIEIARQRSLDRKPRGWLLIALTVALTAYAGFPETGFINGLFAGIWALVRLGTLPRDVYKPYLGKLLLGAGVGVALSAPLLVAFAGYLPHANLGLHATSTSELILPKMGLVGLFMPYVFGPIFASYNLDATNTLYTWWATVGGYLSLPILILAVIGLIKSTFRRPEKIYLVAWSLFCIFATYGILWMNYVAGNIPLIGAAAFARYFPPTYSLATIMLAAMALSYLWERQGSKNKRRWSFLTKRFVLYTGGISALLVVAAWWLLGHRQFINLAQASHIHFWYFGSLTWALFTVLALTGLLLIRRWPRLAAAGVAGLVLFDAGLMFAVPMLSAPRDATINTQPVVFLKQHLGTQRFFSLGPVAPNYGTYYGIASANVNDIPQPQSYSDYITSKLDENVNPITFTGTNFNDPKGLLPPEAFLKNIRNYEAVAVKYVATPVGMFKPEQIEQAGLKQVYQDKTAQIFELSDPKPYFESVGNTCKLDYSVRDTVSADCKQAGKLVRREQYLPGWTAHVNGKEMEPVAYSKIFQSVDLPAGKSAVKFDYLPPYVRYATVLTVIGLAAIAWSYALPESWRARALKSVRMKK